MCCERRAGRMRMKVAMRGMQCYRAGWGWRVNALRDIVREECNLAMV